MPQTQLPFFDEPPLCATGHFRPRLTLQTLGRGDGLLGLRPQGKLGPRGDNVTVARFDWTYQTDAGERWQTPAPTSVLYSRPPATQQPHPKWGPKTCLLRDLAAEADAMDLVWSMGFVPLEATTFQWRGGNDEALSPGGGVAERFAQVKGGGRRPGDTEQNALPAQASEGAMAPSSNS